MTMDDQVLVITGSGAHYARTISHQGPLAAWQTLVCEPALDADLPSVEAIHVETADWTSHLMSVVDTADAVLLVSGVGAAEASAQDARTLDALLGHMRPGTVLIALTSLAIYGDSGAHPVTELDAPSASAEFDPLGALERRVLAAADWLRTAVVRQGLVYGAKGDSLLTDA
ncbi:MAG: hypothetical protein WB767_12145, partial [Nocardioides sp.]